MAIDEKVTQKLLTITSKLGKIKDIDVLFERILTETRKLVNADAGSIYVVKGNMIQIKYGQNDTRQKKLEPGAKLPYTFFSFPISETSICGYVALTGKALNIKDCYAIPESMPYKFNPDTDFTTNYHTKSMFTVPLLNSNGKVMGVLQIINAKDEEGNLIEFNEDSQRIISFFAASTVNSLINTKLTNDMNRRTLKMAELRDPCETYPHVERVSAFCKEIYDRWAFDHKIPDDEKHLFSDTIAIAAKFHDIGKVGISDLVLKKPGLLTPEERRIIQGHTIMGAWVFIENAKNEALSYLDEMSVEIALHHHERWDGKGYPGIVDMNGFNLAKGIFPEGIPIAAEDIPLSARICAVADVFDALINPRSYKNPWPTDKAIEEIKNCAGTQFDPEVVDAFLQRTDRLIQINAAYPDEK
ncbi:MAG: HD domain-containing protein [Treponema sp.]|nr:HD domain-containing protein [Treponema sp.]